MIWDTLPQSEQPLPEVTAPDDPSARPAADGAGHQALYRKWRSRSFEDVVGQEHVTRTLRNAVSAGTVGHAYLFTGARGTGKTSTARVLARAVNCLSPRDGNPCNACPICTSMEERRSLDLIEIDAASNNSVDDIRDLREKVGYAPVEARRKVYVVDEVHMLSTSAFNALLKTLEEPPPHVLFVLATTEVHRVPATIVSRCQRFDFRPISAADTAARLAYVCEQEGLTADAAALDMLARYATGSLRDALGLLDQVRAYSPDHIGVAQVQEALGLADPRALQDLARFLLAGDLAGALGLVEAQAGQGADLRQFGRQAVTYWRDLLLARARNAWPADLGEVPPAPAAIAGVIRAFLQADAGSKRSTAAGLHLELALLEAVASLAPAPAAPRPAAAEPQARPSPGPRDTPPARPHGRGAAPAVRPPEPAPPIAGPAVPEPASAATLPPSTPLTIEEVRAVWPHACESLRRSKPRIAALLNGSCRPLSVEEGGLVLGFLPDFGFHKGQLDDPAKRGAVEEALAAKLGRPCRIRCVMIEGGDEGHTARGVPRAAPAVKTATAAPGPQGSAPTSGETDDSTREARPVLPSPGEIAGAADAPAPPRSLEDTFIQQAARALREVHVDRGPAARPHRELGAER